MIFSINKIFRRVKRFFKDLAGTRWLVLHFIIAIGLIAGTSSMLQQDPETATPINSQVSTHTATTHPSMGSQPASKSADTICIRSILLALLGQ